MDETVAPDGYDKITTSIEFTVDDKGNVTVTENKNAEYKDGVILVKDDLTKPNTYPVSINKTDITGEEELPDAVLVIKKDGTQVGDEWTSKKDSVWTVSLEAGTYTLEETVAPKGYDKITTAIEFTVDDKGNVTVTKNKNAEVKDGVILVKDEYSEHEVKVSKLDFADHVVSGAQLEISGKTKAGNAITPITWTSNPAVEQSFGLKLGTYTIKETYAPNGYEYAEDVTFTVETDGTITVDGKEIEKDEIVMVDAWVQQTVKVSKKDVAGEEIKGAELTITGTTEDGKAIEAITWISTGRTRMVPLQPGSYTLTEVTAPDGYEKAESIDFTVTVDGVDKVQEITMKDTWEDHTVKVSKVDVSGEEIAGAELTITGTTKDGKEVSISWTSEEGKVHEVELQPGDYTLTEVTAPDGYEKAESIDFTVTVEGVDKVQEITMEDTYAKHTVKVSKVDVAGEELEGAELTITGTTKDGEKVEITWTSTKEVHEVELKPGEYTLTEVTAPDGYEKAESIDFTVTVEGVDKVQEITMEDTYAKHTVKVSKVDVAGEEIEGAELTITGTTKDGEKVEITWTSTKEVKEVELKPGEYTLTEVTAPDGYEKAESIDFTVTVEGVDKVQEITMEDTWKDHTVKVSKVDVAGEEIAGAELTITGTTKDGKEVSITWTSEEGKVHEVELQPGDYTLTEVTAPDGYEKAESIDFTVTVEGVDKVQEITMEDTYAKHTVKVSKVDVAGEEIKGAELSITGTTKDGQEVSITWTSTGRARNVELLPGEYTLTEVTAPDGYEKAESINFTVTVEGVDKVQEIEMKDTWKDHTVKISKVDLAGNEIDGAELTITGTTKDGKEIKPITWTSKAGETKEVELQPGTYTLTEVTAPEGFKKAESITFTVDVEGVDEVQEVVMEDDTQVVVTKVDEKTSYKLKDAILQIYEGEVKKANLVKEWTSNELNGEVITGLKTGVKYIIHEKKAPKGYSKAKDLTFMINTNGTVSYSGVKDKNGDLLVKDAKLKAGTHTSVNTNTTFYVGGMTASIFGALAILLRKRKENE